MEGLSLVPERAILVVDDVPEILELFQGLARRIRRVKVRLSVEVNSSRALDLLRSEKYDLVVSDFRMRQVDGIEVLRTARETNPTGHRILMTGYNEVPTSLERIRSADVDAYIQKPLKTQELLLFITEFLVGNQEAIAFAREQARETEATAMTEERGVSPKAPEAA